MKKKIIKIGLSTFLMCFSALAVVTSIDRPEQNRGDLLVSTIDEFNETANAKKANIRRASSAGTLDCSKIYVQTASKDGYDYLRFATAVKGDLDSIVYSGKVQNKGVTLNSKDVTTVYINSISFMRFCSFLSFLLFASWKSYLFLLIILVSYVPVAISM